MTMNSTPGYADPTWRSFARCTRPGQNGTSGACAVDAMLEEGRNAPWSQEAQGDLHRLQISIPRERAHLGSYSAD